MSNHEKNERRHRWLAWITGRQVVRLSVAISVPLTILIALWYPRKEPHQQTPPPASMDSTAAPETIQSIYRERYQGIVDRLNAFDHQTALEALKSTTTPWDAIHDLFIQGILFAWLGQDNLASRRLTAAAVLEPTPLSHSILAQHAGKWRLDAATINDTNFSIEDSRYIRRCYFLQRITDQVVSGCRDDEEKVERLLDWVFRHIAFYEPEAVEVSPMDILLRGYGVCDRSAWVLALLCERAGLPVSIVLLGKPVTEEFSSHTLCQVLVSGRWLLCDTTQGTFLGFGQEGVPATLDHIILRLDREKDNAALQEKYGAFREAGIGVVCEAEGSFPRFSLLEPYLRVIPPHASVFVDLQARLALAATALSQAEADRKNSIGVWDYPFFSLSTYRNPLFAAVRKKNLARMLAYRDARILQLLGFPREAVQAYTKSAETCDAEAREDILFFTAQCHQEAGNLREAEKNFSLYLSRYPEGRWKTMAVYDLARSKEETGDIAAAAKLYGTIDGVMAARQRALMLEARLAPADLPAGATTQPSAP